MRDSDATTSASVAASHGLPLAGELGPGHSGVGRRGTRSFQADLGDEFLGGAGADTGDLVYPVDHLVMWGGSFGDLRVEGGDVRGQDVDAAQHGRADEPVVVVEGPCSASSSCGILRRITPRAILASTRGSRSPAIMASIIARPDTESRLATTVSSLIARPPGPSPGFASPGCVRGPGCAAWASR